MIHSSVRAITDAFFLPRGMQKYVAHEHDSVEMSMLQMFLS